VHDLLRHSAGIPCMAPVPHPVLRRDVELGIDNGGGPAGVPTDGSAPVNSVAELSRLLRPLGMADTYFLVPTAATLQLTAAYAGPSVRQGNGTRASMRSASTISCHPS